jgi:hypothetical protein
VTRTTNARIAGFTFLFYIAAGITGMVLFGRATGGEDIVLAVTLYAITRDEDRDLAMLGMCCRVAEGITGIFVARTLGLLWLAAPDGHVAAETGAVRVLGGFLLGMGAWNPGATCFAVGSALFSWLMLSGRMIPKALAWLGVLASILLVALLPFQLAGLLGGPVTSLMWLPMLVFELTLALWLLIRGAASPAWVGNQTRED